MSSRCSQPPPICLNKDLETMTATKEKWDKSMFTECLFVPNKINSGCQQNLLSIHFFFKDCPLVLVTLIYENVLASRDNLSLSQNLRTCPAVASGNPPLSERHLQQQQKREATLKERAEVPLASLSQILWNLDKLCISLLSLPLHTSPGASRSLASTFKYVLKSQEICKIVYFWVLWYHWCNFD